MLLSLSQKDYHYHALYIGVNDSDSNDSNDSGMIVKMIVQR